MTELSKKVAAINVPEEIRNLQVAVDEYRSRARMVGVPRARAEMVLQEEMEKALTSTTVTPEMAIEAARRRIIG